MLAELTGCILAGGGARRFDGVDKGLLELAGKPLVEHAYQRLALQVGDMLVSANRNLDAYARLGAPVLTDARLENAGPLAGCLAGLREARTPWLAIVPCDAPFLPEDLAARLHAGAQTHARTISVAVGNARLQPVFALISTSLADDLEDYLDGGGRRVDTWYARHGAVEVAFEDCPEAFFNINSRADLDRATERCAAHA